MITLITSKNNEFNDFCVNIDQYYAHMEELISLMLKCSCGISGSCIKYGWYNRTLIIDDKCINIRLQRVYCKHCKKTHTIMPRFIVPYERKPFDYIYDLITEYKDSKIDKADYELVRYMSIFNKWNNKLKVCNITLGDGLKKVITFCAFTFKMCFMQATMRNNKKLFKVEYHVIQLPT